MDARHFIKLLEMFACLHNKPVIEEATTGESLRMQQVKVSSVPDLLFLK